MDINERRKRANIYFSRTYRHFKVNSKEQLIYVFALIVPTIVLFLLFYTEISHFICNLLIPPLSKVFPQESLIVSSTEFLPLFGNVHFLTLPNLLPVYNEILFNLFISIVLFVLSLLANKKKNKNTPLPIYFAFVLLIHIISCIYFLFARDYFPYTATEFSELYMKQQIVIWFSLIFLSGFVLGVIGYGKVAVRMILFAILITYSFIFGIVRYLAFSYIISAGSSLYMASLFFTFGPLYDFLYFVFFYSVFINREIRYFGYGEGRNRWQWL